MSTAWFLLVIGSWVCQTAATGFVIWRLYVGASREIQRAQTSRRALRLELENMPRQSERARLFGEMRQGQRDTVRRLIEMQRQRDALNAIACATIGYLNRIECSLSDPLAIPLEVRESAPPILAMTNAYREGDWVAFDQLAAGRAVQRNSVGVARLLAGEGKSKVDDEVKP